MYKLIRFTIRMSLFFVYIVDIYIYSRELFICREKEREDRRIEN